MVKRHPTPYPDVNEILNTLYASVKENLQDQLVGMYLFGSLANGDFDNNSDIDVLVVTDAEIADDTFSALRAMHKRMAEIDSPWAIQLEVSYIPRKALRRFDPADMRHPHLDRGNCEELHMMEHASDWIIQRHILRERGVVISGPEPKTLIEPVSQNDLRQAVVDVLPLWFNPILEDLSHVLHTYLRRNRLQEIRRGVGEREPGQALATIDRARMDRKTKPGAGSVARRYKRNTRNDALCASTNLADSVPGR
jgi:predicted nucleotidyltransferase